MNIDFDGKCVRIFVHSRRLFVFFNLTGPFAIMGQENLKLFLLKLLKK